MKNRFELSDSYLTDLNHEESVAISGGDKFMRDLGYAIGYCWELYKDAAKHLSSQSF